MRSNAKTVPEYLNSLPKDRRHIIEGLRNIIVQNLPAGYEETMQYGLIEYAVPLKRYPRGYLGDRKTPLPCAALASQKNYLSLYLMSIYGDRDFEEWFKQECISSGKTLDIGKSCVRFKRLDDLPLNVIAKAVARVPVNEFIKQYERVKKDGRKQKG
jgi:hypothetical protein